MNTRFVAVDEDGREIEDDDDTDIALQSPVDGLDSSAIPRVGETIMFYNIGDGATWEVTAVVWMVGAYRTAAPHQAAAHVCVMIRKRGKG